MRRTLRRGAAILVALAVLWAAWSLERADRGLQRSDLLIGDTPATLFRPADATADLPLVVVAHGFGGSRQMMRAISLTLARSGHAVLAFDFPGHGRNPTPLVPDVTRIEGTATQLVETTLEVAAAGLALDGVREPVAFLGHSMATDVAIRAAERTGAEDVVAISMYSEAITPEAPQRLLIVSGQFEGGLREVAHRAVAQVEQVPEGTTARDGDVARRAVFAPLVGHVGVLWNTTTLREVRDWLGGDAAVAAIGPWIGVLLAGTVLLGHLLVAEIGAARPRGTLGARRHWLAMAAPVLPAILAAWALRLPVAGLAGFTALAGFFAVWGLTQLAILRPAFGRIGGGTVAFALWSLIFALALDRYAAAFVPTGPRVAAFALLLVGCVPAMVAEMHVAVRAPVWRRLLGRAVLIVALALPMLLAPTRLGLMFTVLPVLVLFFAVYGALARRVALRQGATGPGIALGVVLAWAIAASTPLFAAA